MTGSNQYDVIVCGAGPSGTIAALTAARSGLKVALLEKYPLPRHKTCGGGTPMAMQQFLYDLAPEAFVECNVTHLRQTWKFGDPYLAAINLTDTQTPRSIWMMQRSVFDYALAQQATQAGAEIWAGWPVTAIDLTSEGVTVQAHNSRGQWVGTARYLIGADGASGISAQVAGLRPHRTIALAMELEYPHQWGNHPDLQPTIAHLEYGAVPRGYAWIFPKAHHLNIGAGVFSPAGGDPRRNPQIRQQLKQAIRGYLDRFELPAPDPALPWHAHPLPTWNGREPLQTSNHRLLLVGDAAGLVNPLFGDGILHAVKSGLIAANCIIQDTVPDYTRQIHQEFAQNFDAAGLLAQWFYRFPHLFYRYGVKHETAASLAIQLLSGELEFQGMVGRALRRVGRELGQRTIATILRR